MNGTRDLFYAIAASLRGGFVTPADRAGLRRMDPTRLDASGFWKLAGLHLDGVLPGELEARTRAETAWGAIIVALASFGALQTRNERLGSALASADYSEQRFVGLLRADSMRLLDEIPRLARFLAAKSIRADLSDSAQLLISAHSETARRSLARDYYSTLSKAS